MSLTRSATGVTGSVSVAINAGSAAALEAWMKSAAMLPDRCVPVMMPKIPA